MTALDDHFIAFTAAHTTWDPSSFPVPDKGEKEKGQDIIKMEEIKKKTSAHQKKNLTYRVHIPHSTVDSRNQPLLGDSKLLISTAPPETFRHPVWDTVLLLLYGCTVTANRPLSAHPVWGTEPPFISPVYTSMWQKKCVSHRAAVGCAVVASWQFVAMATGDVGS